MAQLDLWCVRELESAENIYRRIGRAHLALSRRTIILLVLPCQPGDQLRIERDGGTTKGGITQRPGHNAPWSVAQTIDFNARFYWVFGCFRCNAATLCS